MLKIAVLGLGVGYALSCALAEAGYYVLAIDVNAEVIKNPRRDKSVDFLIDKARKRIEEHIEFTTHYQGILNCDPIIVCVGTGDEKKLVLGQVEGAIRQCLRILKGTDKHPTILVYSTLPFCSSKRIREIFLDENIQIDQDVRYCYMPLMIAQGSTSSDFVNPPFIAFGAYSKDTAQKAMDFYIEFIRKSCLFKGKNPPNFITDPEVAELGKLVANAFLSTKISFSNMVARFCEENQLDGDTLLRIVGSDWRISDAMLRPGYSFGGACFPRDLESLIESFRDSEVPCDILEATKEVNTRRVEDPLHVIEKDRLGKRVLILGTAYKAGLKDTRGSPSLSLIELMHNKGYTVNSYDPNIDSRVTLDTICVGQEIDVVVVATSEPIFKSLKKLCDDARVGTVLDYADVVDVNELPKGVRMYKAGVGWVR